MEIRYVFTALLLLSSLAWSQATTSNGDADAAQQAAPASSSQGTTAPNTSSQGGDSTQLIITKYRKPDYPMEAARREIQGHVVIHLLIDENGNVESAEAVSGNSMLTDSAIRAMKTWKFKPYLKDGKAVKVSTKMPYDFAFKEDIKDIPVTAQTPSPTAPATAVAPANGNAAPNSPQKVRVAYGVSQGLLIHKVQPVYPQSARVNHVQGTVVLQAVIGKDGRIKDLHVVSGPSELTDAAIGAVEQWRYKPYFLNGEPVEVETRILVNFALSGF